MRDYADSDNNLEAIYDGDDSFRLPNWRYLRAQQVEKYAGDTKYDDNWVKKASDYYQQRKLKLNTLAPGSSARQRTLRSLRRTFYDIHEAISLSEDNTRMKSLVEAALMDGSIGMVTIAQKLGISELTLKAYEALFFDVRSRLGSPLFVRGAILHVLIAKGSASVTPDLLWKGLSYAYGVDKMLAYASTSHLSAEVYSLLDSALKGIAVRRAYEASLSRSITTFNAHEVIDEHITITRHKEENDVDDGEVARAQAETIQSMHLSALSIHDNLNPDDVSAIEIRASERMRREVKELAQNE